MLNGNLVALGVVVLRVKEIFHSIQGEGPYTGHSAIFIRLAGCNLKCSFCDEHHSRPYEEMEEYHIISTIGKLAASVNISPKIIVVTGGEPFLQNFSFLSKMAHEAGFQVHVETNGTLFHKEHDYQYHNMKIVCSPKKEKIVHPLMNKYITWYKLIVKKGDMFNQVNINSRNIYIQPMDEQCVIKNKENMEWAVYLCKQYNYKLSLQTHKITQVR